MWLSVSDKYLKVFHLAISVHMLAELQPDTIDIW